MGRAEEYTGRYAFLISDCFIHPFIIIPVLPSQLFLSNFLPCLNSFGPAIRWNKRLLLLQLHPIATDLWPSQAIGRGLRNLIVNSLSSFASTAFSFSLLHRVPVPPSYSHISACSEIRLGGTSPSLRTAFRELIRAGQATHASRVTVPAT